jgi:hypothetical protein
VVDDLRVTASRPGQVSLAWTPPTVPVARTTLQRTELEKDGSFSDIGWYSADPEITEGSPTTVVDVPTYGEQAGYCFRLLFERAGGSSTHSNPVCVRTP